MSNAVVRAPEEAASRKDGAFDYVILCIKALPDVYDLASVIAPPYDVVSVAERGKRFEAGHAYRLPRNSRTSTLGIG